MGQYVHSLPRIAHKRIADVLRSVWDEYTTFTTADDLRYFAADTDVQLTAVLLLVLLLLYHWKRHYEYKGTPIHVFIDWSNVSIGARERTCIGNNNKYKQKPLLSLLISITN